MNRSYRTRSPIVAPLSVSVAAAVLALALAGAPAPVHASDASALLERIAAAKSPEERTRAAEELAGLGAEIVDELREFSKRKRSSSSSDRRDVLRAIEADLPDNKGRFSSSKKQKVQSGDDFDWLAELASIDAKRKGYKDVFADVAMIRALAASQEPAGAEAIIEFAFSDDGLIYRDECGRYLRKMAPYSLPALIIAASDSEKNRSLRRYAAYQLDRMDRDDPNKVLNHASDDTELLLATLEAYAESKHREAIPPLFQYADHVSATVRERARATILAYVTGPEAPEAPKRKLALPGGKLTEEEQPLWLNYQDFATAQIHEQYELLFEEGPPRRTSASKLAEAIFERLDERRTEAWNKQFDDARQLADAGKWAEAAAAFDSILAAQPEHPERPTMAQTYFEYGRTLAEQKSYREAATAFSKAHGLAPDGPVAQEALSEHYANLGRALEAEGKDASAAYRRAQVERRAKQSGDASVSSLEEAPQGHRWMLYAGIGGGAGALIFMILGLAVRRR